MPPANIPLGQSLYLAMLQQDRQDMERDEQRFLDDEARRNQSMMAIANYSLKKQAQDQAHERELQKLDLQRRGVIQQERMEQHGLMERRRLQEQGATLRTGATQYGRTLDREQQLAIAEARHGQKTRELDIKAGTAKSKGEYYKSIREQSLSMETAKDTVTMLQKKLDTLNRFMGKTHQAMTSPTNIKRKDAIQKALDVAIRDYRVMAQLLKINISPGLVADEGEIGGSIGEGGPPGGAGGGGLSPEQLADLQRKLRERLEGGE